MTIDLNAVRALADAATPGPWYTNEPGPYVHAVWSKDHPDDKVPVNPIAKMVGLADARFIAAARTLVPALCDEAERAAGREPCSLGGHGESCGTRGGAPCCCEVPAPEGMTADKLRLIADYITESDSIIAQVLDTAGVRFERAGKDLTGAWSELVAGRAMQEDLRAWAAHLDRSEATP